MTRAKKTSQISRVLLQLIYISFLGYHGGKALHLYFGFSIIDTVLIIAVIELSVVLIDWTGLKFRILWLFKSGLLVCSVFFSIYGFISDYNAHQNKIIELASGQIVSTNQGKIDNHLLDIESFNQKRPELLIEISENQKSGEKTVGYYKGKPYSGFDVVRWRKRDLKVLDAKILSYKKQINTWKDQDNLAATTIKKTAKSIEIETNNLFIVWLKNVALGILVCFIGLINMFISNITDSIEIKLETEEEKEERTSKVARLSKRKGLPFNKKIESKKESLALNLSQLFFSRHRNKASP